MVLDKLIKTLYGREKGQDEEEKGHSLYHILRIIIKPQ